MIKYRRACCLVWPSVTLFRPIFSTRKNVATLVVQKQSPKVMIFTFSKKHRERPLRDFKPCHEDRMKVGYWIGVASWSHLKRGRAEGFAQLCHGKAAPLRRMSVGDWLVYYSPKTEINGAEPLQMITAIGRIVGENVYQYPMPLDNFPLFAAMWSN